MYRFETIYTKDNIRILARVQVHTYYWKKLIVMLLSGMILIGVSLAWVNSGRLAALLAAAMHQPDLSRPVSVKKHT